MKPTDQQLNVVKQAKAGKSLLVEALAGCGKTTTLKLASASLSPGIALAFNRRAASELKAALPDTWKVATLNSIGMQALFRSGIKPDLHEDKLLDLAEELGIPNNLRRDTIATTRWARILGIIPKAPGVPRLSGLCPDNEAGWTEAMLSAEAPEANLEYARELLALSIRKAFKKGLVDFDDQIYLSALFLDSYPQFRTILVDEAQDLSALNILQLKRLGAHSAQVIAVGDRHQAIYAWRGAESNSLDQLQKTFSLTECPLTVTFRCPRKVVDRWSGIIDGFRAAQGNPDGTVSTSLALPSLQSNDAVLCHTNSTLLKHAIDLAQENRPFRFIGREFVGQIRWLHKASGGNLDTAVRIMSARITKIETLGGYSAPLRETLQIYQMLHKLDPDRVLETMEHLLSGNTGPIFSTIYRAKGLEWNRVFLLKSHELREAADEGQNQNVLYVGETRTRSDLVLVEPE